MSKTKQKQKKAERKCSVLPVKKKKEITTGTPRWVRMQLKFKKVKGFEENKEAPQ